MAIPTDDRETVLRAIEAWPLDDQVSLAQTILARTREQMEGGVSAQRPSWRQMAGLAANGQPSPSDDEVAQWLDEYRMEKYG